ncbi:dihydrofolate reductase family protein [Catenulispora sp. NL8]|uniref:Dihydrofolate reductase family protein n=1 Tax=Catenulispora pinistramenti TaxID=2705254 RepID=A0ABS5L298_9ACTN|nr:dihydrofolate reductase family protein [Catenulispora pinistramenti]MBS2552461.1 dihydrofolate reductase family protein [Catenulispora pinistramenti]
MSENRDRGKVFTALAVSVDGYITGRDPRVGHGLGDGGMLFDWYFDGDTQSRVLPGFHLSVPSARVFDQVAGRLGAVVVGRKTFEDSDRFGGGSPHADVPLVLLSHHADGVSERQTLVTTGIADAIGAARELAGGKDVGLMGGGMTTEALKAGLVDELILHQVPILLGGGRPFFQELPAHIRLTLVEAVPAPGVTHLRYEVAK